MDKMKELEVKLKKLEKMKQMNTLPTLSRIAFIPWVAVSCIHSGQGAEK